MNSATMFVAVALCCGMLGGCSKADATPSVKPPIDTGVVLADRTATRVYEVRRYVDSTLHVACYAFDHGISCVKLPTAPAERGGVK